MIFDTIIGIFIPLFGTVGGAAAVYLMRGGLNLSLTRFLSGFAAGVMVAASVWSLLIPAIEESDELGSFAFIPSVLGFLSGIISLLFVDLYFPLEQFFNSQGGYTKNTAMMVIAVTAHNLPEGIAVGAAFAGVLSGNADITFAAALSLSIGIGIQNLPEGAIISMPLYASGVKRTKAFSVGALSGIVEPIGALLAILLSRYLAVLPFLLSFAAGTMFYVVVEELIPEMKSGKASRLDIISFTVGFLLMMSLDVALG